tara:strand:- start:7395 stop:7583 length:189 start_codon:yes stop_codon:yes gene_type:complete
MIINLVKDISKLIFKRAKEPTSVLAVLTFANISNPEMLTNGICQAVTGLLAIYSYIKSDKSD